MNCEFKIVFIDNNERNTFFFISSNVKESEGAISRDLSSWALTKKRGARGFKSLKKLTKIPAPASFEDPIFTLLISGGRLSNLSALPELGHV